MLANTQQKDISQTEDRVPEKRQRIEISESEWIQRVEKRPELLTANQYARKEK